MLLRDVVRTAGRWLESSHILDAASLGRLLCVWDSNHVGSGVEKTTDLICILTMLDSLKLCSVRSHDVPGATSCRALGRILDLRTGQRLRYLLVFALILNFDIGC